MGEDGRSAHPRSLVRPQNRRGESGLSLVWIPNLEIYVPITPKNVLCTKFVSFPDFIDRFYNMPAKVPGFEMTFYSMIVPDDERN
jgi:hypothetical protein